jgi:hypothetical protein
LVAQRTGEAQHHEEHDGGDGVADAPGGNVHYFAPA